MANKVRAALEKDQDIASLVVDNTSMVLIEMKEGKSPNEESINDLLKKEAGAMVKIKTLKKDERDKPAEKYLVAASGYA